VRLLVSGCLSIFLITESLPYLAKPTLLFVLQRPLLSPQPTFTEIIEDDLLLYSAHWDIRPLYGLEPPYVRILGSSLKTWQVVSDVAGDLRQTRRATPGAQPVSMRRNSPHPVLEIPEHRLTKVQRYSIGIKMLTKLVALY
jgi:hypothetical protein